MGTSPPAAPPHGTSTRPYLIRALHDWCTDNGFTPYVAVHVDASVHVPQEYVKDDEIVLNIGFEATSSLKLGNEFIEFKARFGGTARDIVVPVDHVIAIYARENGQGMAFPAPADDAAAGVAAGATPTNLHLATPDVPSGKSASAPAQAEPPDQPPPGPRPTLKRVK